MGIVSFGPPDEILLELANLANANIFIETGTYVGDTTRWASEHFAFVYTIEKAEVLYNKFSKELAKIQGVKPMLGDTRELLPRIVEQAGDESAVFWLDAHWSFGVTAGEKDVCPLLDELAILEGRDKDIILIDDARLFLCPPPLPHHPDDWPGIADIVDVIHGWDKKPFMQIIDDVIFIIPDQDNMKKALVEYGQKRASDFWQYFCQIQKGKK